MLPSEIPFFNHEYISKSYLLKRFIIKTSYLFQDESVDVSILNHVVITLTHYEEVPLERNIARY